MKCEPLPRSITMRTIEVTAKKKVGDDAREATVSIQFGETAEESIKSFGADVVNSNFIQSAKITAQAAMRRMLESGKSAEDISAVMADFKPGVQLQRSSDPAAAMLGKFATMTAEEQAEFINSLKARANG